jgi:hypothetical protein
MPGKITFRYRASIDVVIAEVNWNLETEADIVAWCEEYRAYFTRMFGPRKVDLILELSNFRVNPRVGAAFGKARADLLSEFTVRSYRVAQNARERAFMNTSSVLYHAPANHYETIDDAIVALVADRAKDAPR